MRLARVQRGRRGVADVERRVEVGLADLQVDDLATLSFERSRAGENAERGLRAEPLETVGEAEP